MRIGITCYPSYGGSGVVATELGRQLARRGHSVHFITYDVPFRLNGFQESVFFHEVNVPAYPLFQYPPYLLALANKMVEVARYENLDILHVHYAIPHATSAYLAQQVLAAQAGGPRPAVITTLHGTDITLVGNDPSFRDIIAFSIDRSDGVTAVSRALKRQTLETFPVKADIEVIHNFIDPDDYRDLTAERCRRCLARPGEAVVSHISNFRPVKRAELVVRLFAEACRDIPSRLVLIGDGPDIPKAHEEAARRGVSERVVFLGRQEQVTELLAASDVFLLPSVQESFGLAALEAMAAGVPVIASRVGGLPEVVGDGRTEGPGESGETTGDSRGGLLYDVDDIEGMRAGLRSVIADRDLHAALSAGARERAFRHFSTERIVPLYEDYYARVLRRRG